VGSKILQTRRTRKGLHIPFGRHAWRCSQICLLHHSLPSSVVQLQVCERPKSRRGLWLRSRAGIEFADVQRLHLYRSSLDRSRRLGVVTGSDHAEDPSNDDEWTVESNRIGTSTAPEYHQQSSRCHLSTSHCQAGSLLLGTGPPLRRVTYEGHSGLAVSNSPTKSLLDAIRMTGEFVTCLPCRDAVEVRVSENEERGASVRHW